MSRVTKMSTSIQRVLLRFDDICPTMNWRVWEEIEDVLRTENLKPILAVIPDNHDHRLVVAPANPHFWTLVREWQSLGWTIALHGYQHVYENRNPGLMGITPQSEFAGLDRERQAAKLKAGLSIFADNGVEVNSWVAPSHSFDQVTLELLANNGIMTVSDGLTNRPFKDSRGILWIPCQMWEEVQPRRSGVWTVCYHHNRWGPDHIDRFRRNVAKFKENLTSVVHILKERPWRPLAPFERLQAWGRGIWWFRGRRILRRCIYIHKSSGQRN